MEMLKFFTDKQNNCVNRYKFKDIKVTAFDSAVFIGRKDMFEYLWKERPQDVETSRMFEFAIKGKQTAMVEYLLREHRSLSIKVQDKLIGFASSVDCGEIVKLLYHHNIAMSPNSYPIMKYFASY
ncbi:hypothetical protein PPL_11651 [Heterostelium album PN500]|uniref:Uncharacterized protein n=1 Tax=Heterostelium pallidum (strain ATCC 26659 / Pp 5 / PN500) TaxID=670386 RepID=D3BVC5_HETP5|nr:hypothetical protein PPL_11651 [Heterostelium album PN500]EFA74682.1 hypothetical protein PPL_11651 [Heterostelium album PN500]|eukprot:XP_020426816.1 hypothetical protein PPL_11651 [Heterostelium album PN500]